MRAWYIWWVEYGTFTRRGTWYPARPLFLTDYEVESEEFKVGQQYLGARMYRFRWNGYEYKRDTRSHVELLSGGFSWL
jgi:hypothetical protein